MADTLTTLIEKRHPSLGESAQLRERLATLADKLKLGIDEQDIKAFLLAEASKFLFFTQENSLLAGGETLFEELIERAVNRTLVGVRILNIPKTEIKELRSLVKSIANEIGRSLDTSILQNTEINAARTAFVLIYERLLFWMRLIQDSIDLDFPIMIYAPITILNPIGRSSFSTMSSSINWKSPFSRDCANGKSHAMAGRQTRKTWSSRAMIPPSIPTRSKSPSKV